MPEFPAATLSERVPGHRPLGSPGQLRVSRLFRTVFRNQQLRGAELRPRVEEMLLVQQHGRRPGRGRPVDHGVHDAADRRVVRLDVLAAHGGRGPRSSESNARAFVSVLCEQMQRQLGMQRRFVFADELVVYDLPGRAKQLGPSRLRVRSRIGVPRGRFTHGQERKMAVFRNRR